MSQRIRKVCQVSISNIGKWFKYFTHISKANWGKNCWSPIFKQVWWTEEIRSEKSCINVFSNSSLHGRKFVCHNAFTIFKVLCSFSMMKVFHLKIRFSEIKYQQTTCQLIARFYSWKVFCIHAVRPAWEVTGYMPNTCCLLLKNILDTCCANSIGSNSIYAQHLLFILEKCSEHMLCEQHWK